MSTRKKLVVYLDVNMPNIPKSLLGRGIFKKVKVITLGVLEEFKALPDNLVLKRVVLMNKKENRGLKAIFLTRDRRFREDSNYYNYVDCPVLVRTLQDIYPEKKMIGAIKKSYTISLIAQFLKKSGLLA